MKRKALIAFFVILLILMLTGCTMVPPGESLEDMAEQTVYEYGRAIINRQYELAKWHCITGGVWNNKTDEWEEYINTNSEGEASVVIYGPTFYEETEVIGDDIIVYTRITTDITAFPGSSYHEGDFFEYEIELIKQNFPPGDCKLK